MKKLVSILLLFCLLFTLVGHHIVFYIQQAGIKAEMKKMIRSTLSKEEEQVFCFSLDDKTSGTKLEWEDEHEFKLDGKMYDVIEKKTENGKLFIRCISDEKETALVKKYEKINNDSGNNSKSKTALLIKLISNSYIASSDFDLFAKNIPAIQKSFFITNIISIDRSDVLTPPPQLS